MKKFDELISELSIEEKIGQMFMIGFKEENLTPDVQDFINKNNIGFINIFARNVTSIEQGTSLMNKIHTLAKIQPMIFTGQEGGVVCQFGELTSTFSSPMGLAAAGNVAFVELAGKLMAEDLDFMGIDGFITPTIDVNYESNNPIIGLRSFSDDAQTVIESGNAFKNGLEKIGLAAMLKHYPGHGGSRLDSHLVLPTLDVSEEFFTANDLEPFKVMSESSDFIMTAHVSVPDIDPSGLPATFSKIFLSDILRDRFNFRGVLITDCLEMDVIKNNYSAEEIIRYSIDAGADVLLISHDIEFQREILKILVDKVKNGKIPIERINNSVTRILEVKQKYKILGNLKKRSVANSVNSIRGKREIEDFICRHTIVMLRNKLKKIPLSHSQNLGIIEWDKSPSTVQLNESMHKSYLIKYAKEYFEKAEVLILPLKKADPSIIKDFLSSYENIIVSPYSRTPEVEILQADMIREIIKFREDVVIVATGNPYDIRHFEETKTYLVTFGFRDTQIRALFDVLTGKFKPVGKLPVEIKGIFPRWYRCNDWL